MRFNFVLGAAAMAVCAAVSFCAGAQAADQPNVQGFAQLSASHPPIEAYAMLPAMSQPSLSPDGKHIAILKPRGLKREVMIYDVDNPTAKPMSIPYKDGFIVDVDWANNEWLLLTLEMNRKADGGGVHSWHRAATIRIDGTKSAQLMRNVEARDINLNSANLVDLALDKPDKLYMSIFVDDEISGVRHDLMEVDVETGRAVAAAHGISKTMEFFTDGHGKPVARIDRTRRPYVDHLMLYDDGDWDEAAEYDAEGDKSAGFIGLKADGTALVRSMRDESTGRAVLMERPLKIGAETLLADNPRYDIEAALIDPWTKLIIGYVVIADMPHFHYFDAKMQSTQDGLEKLFKGKAVHAVSRDLAMKRIVAAVDGPNQPRQWYLIDMAARNMRPIGSAYPMVKEADLGTVRLYPYKARDGLDIPAYLTLPPGKEAKNLPTVIMPHGGPMARDTMGFDWMAQFLANRGYAVLQPNFRGSSGYGNAFEKAGYGEWGGKMQDDLTDGVKKMIADGITDPKRICIVGASYGGYAALAGAAFTPDLYACAASYAGVSDLVRLWHEEGVDEAGKKYKELWKRFVGDRWKELDKMKAVSPINHVDAIKAPILLMHGSADSVVRIAQSQDMEKALRDKGKKVGFITIKGETHHLQYAETRIIWLRTLERFLKDNIGS